MADQSVRPEDENSNERGSRTSLEAEQIRWEMDKLNVKRRILDEVVGLLQHDNAINARVARIVESMATLAERDPAPFWHDRSTSSSPQAKLQFPFPPLPQFPIPPFPPFPPIPPIPLPGDVFGQVVDLIKAEKAMIQGLIKDLLT